MRLDVEIEHEGEAEITREVMLSVGGKWDRRLGSYDGDADTRLVVRPHAGELPALGWFASWLGVHAGRRSNPPMFDEAAMAALEQHLVEPAEVYSAMFAGGRRGGKTWTGALICALYAVQFPDAIVWAVNPSDQKHDEVRDYMRELLAETWVAHYTSADGWELINGSTINLKSAYTGSDPDAIKEGKAHLIWLNEAQKMKKRVYVVARGAIADNSGLVLCCANPPVEAKDQQWVGDFAADAQAGRALSHYVHFNPLDNPHINRLALMSLRAEVDIRTYRIEVLGEFLPPADTVAYNWIRTRDGNERKMPSVDDPNWVDVTEEFLELREEGTGFIHLIGMDYQVFPHMGGPVYRLYAPRSQVPDDDNVVLWGVDEVVIRGDEAQWCEEAKGKGYHGATTLIVGDGTGKYQHSRRGQSDEPPTWKGRGSFDILREGGFWNIAQPSRRIDGNNPHVLDRCRAMCSMIENAERPARRRLFLDPDRCPKTAKSVREWPTVNGKPSRRHEAAHLGDAASYPIVRLFPRILRSERVDDVDPVKALVDKPRQLPLTATTKALGPPPRATGRPPRSL